MRSGPKSFYSRLIAQVLETVPHTLDLPNASKKLLDRGQSHDIFMCPAQKDIHQGVRFVVEGAQDFVRVEFGTAHSQHPFTCPLAKFRRQDQGLCMIFITLSRFSEEFRELQRDLHWGWWELDELQDRFLRACFCAMHKVHKEGLVFH